ncbi:hypothetical protein EMPS_10080 [Entomortierella parvispora]|uniref:Large ribosomal subunit protein mL67 n=1 Tax=Entomortierella parvispora TaxID=205924 RepID=A0A9P3HJE1_9FUNG|nr:hypothetical protein EMPS_10080 [Entomortierella parvispora]
MSAAASVAATSKAAVKQASSTVYLFRHIQTAQVLVSMQKTVERQNLKQITDETRRPAHVRHDHWHPLAAVKGLPDHKAALSLHNSLRDHQLNMHQRQFVQNKEHMAQPKRLRAPQEMNQVETTLVKLVELLNEQPALKASKGQGVEILWERDGVRKQILEKEGLPTLLEGIQHGELVIKRGRDIANA